MATYMQDMLNKMKKLLRTHWLTLSNFFHRLMKKVDSIINILMVSIMLCGVMSVFREEEFNT